MLAISKVSHSQIVVFTHHSDMQSYKVPHSTKYATTHKLHHSDFGLQAQNLHCKKTRRRNTSRSIKGADRMSAADTIKQ